MQQNLLFENSHTYKNFFKERVYILKGKKNKRRRLKKKFKFKKYVPKFILKQRLKRKKIFRKHVLRATSHTNFIKLKRSLLLKTLQLINKKISHTLVQINNLNLNIDSNTSLINKLNKFLTSLYKKKFILQFKIKYFKFILSLYLLSFKPSNLGFHQNFNFVTSKFLNKVKNIERNHIRKIYQYILFALFQLKINKKHNTSKAFKKHKLFSIKQLKNFTIRKKYSLFKKLSYKSLNFKLGHYSRKYKLKLKKILFIKKKMSLYICLSEITFIDALYKQVNNKIKDLTIKNVFFNVKLLQMILRLLKSIKTRKKNFFIRKLSKLEKNKKSKLINNIKLFNLPAKYKNYLLSLHYLLDNYNIETFISKLYKKTAKAVIIQKKNQRHNSLFNKKSGFNLKLKHKSLQKFKLLQILLKKKKKNNKILSKKKYILRNILQLRKRLRKISKYSLKKKNKKQIPNKLKKQGLKKHKLGRLMGQTILKKKRILKLRKSIFLKNRKWKISLKKSKLLRKPMVYIHIATLPNNLIITVTNIKGNTLFWASAGLVGMKGAKKTSPYTATLIGKIISEKLRKKKYQYFSVIFNGVGRGRRLALRAIFGKRKNIFIKNIWDKTSSPHNGCRKPKRRRK